MIVSEILRGDNMRTPMPIAWIIAGALLALAGCSALTPLQSAIISGDQQRVERLLGEGVNVNAGGDPSKLGRDHPGALPPLHLAASKGRTAAVDLLLKKGALVNLAESYGYTPLHYAARNGHREVVKLLIANGADVNALSLDREILVGTGVAPGLPPGVWAPASTHIEIEPGRTPLDLAIEQGHPDVGQLLRQHGARRGQGR